MPSQQATGLADRLIVALDTNDARRARELTIGLRKHCAMVKIGSQFWAAHGPDGVRALEANRRLMIDLKWHDIPAQVAGAVLEVLPLEPRLITVHAAGGRRMIEAACEAADAAPRCRPLVLAVAALTSLDHIDRRTLYGAAAAGLMPVLLAKAAIEAGADGLVCGGGDVRALRHEFSRIGKPVLIVVPGIRRAGFVDGNDADHWRPVTAQEAIAGGADYIVVGRPITAASDPVAAAEAMAMVVPA